jgi:hypothetical protein
MSPSPMSASPERRGLVHVDRAIAELRRGLPVVLTAPGADTFLFILAAEFATEDMGACWPNIDADRQSGAGAKY